LLEGGRRIEEVLAGRSPEGGHQLEELGASRSVSGRRERGGGGKEGELGRK
jgi:hypothetical protein